MLEQRDFGRSMNRRAPSTPVLMTMANTIAVTGGPSTASTCPDRKGVNIQKTTTPLSAEIRIITNERINDHTTRSAGITRHMAAKFGPSPMEARGKFA
ncbi:hypothetical protein N7532_003194 [Penicillium argentinense]|uniref:Uncharacterized protein n=1 Tax=Penicillium argentinense TaxID=1131581 RepID=A0A9W9FMJ9_9EURO|nr:uncharacterized protein N7532_003194 [Penicillium argentinense]KAJ5102665.1 hypothetical protein N7532_003194 [Penicillium argentinense]